MAQYFRQAIEPATRNAVIDEALEHIRPLEPDCIACRGVSGQSVGSILAYLLNVDLIVVRKDGERSHGPKVSGRAGKRIVIVDDLIATGTTVREIMKELKRKPLAIYLYSDNASDNTMLDGVPVVCGARVEAAPLRST